MDTKEITETARVDNEAHRTSVLIEVHLAFLKLGLSNELGKSVVLAIRDGKIPNIEIKY